MEKISIPEEDVVPLEQIAPDVAGLRVLIVNVYGIARATGEWLATSAVKTSVSGSRNRSR